MRSFNWDIAKNERLITERGVCFEEIIFAIENGRVLDIVDHPNPGRYRNQKMFIVEWNDYAYLVPFVEDKGSEDVFLKTIIPSRKATRRYLGGQA